MRLVAVGGVDPTPHAPDATPAIAAPKTWSTAPEATAIHVRSESAPPRVSIVTTVYDPSDGTRKIPGVFEDAGLLPLEWLHDLNERISSIGTRVSQTVVADAHHHFLGHGVTAAESERWYWQRSWVEPNAVGASEIRRLWLDALQGAAED